MNRKLTINYKDFIIPVFFIGMFLTNSGFGQTFFMGVGLSFIISNLFLVLSIISFKYLDKSIRYMLVLYLIYSITVAIISFKHDYFLIFIAVSTVFAFMSTIYIYVSDKSFYRGLKYTAVINIAILTLYHYKIALSGWNPNNISFLTTFGLLCMVVLLSNVTTLKKTILYTVIIIMYLSILLQTGSRNGLLIGFIGIITIILLYPIIKKPRILKIYTILTISMPAIIPSIVTYINKSYYLAIITDLSRKYFGKGSFFSGRDIFWGWSRALIDGKWIFGQGESMYHYIYPHNMFYSVVHMFGIIGYVLYGLLIYIIIRTIIKYSENDKISIVCVLVFLANFWGQIAENNFYTSDISFFFPYVFLSIALGRGYYLRKRLGGKVYEN